MAVLQDIPGALERVNQQARQMAADLGVQPEVIFGYLNRTGHFPQDIRELEAFGNTPDKNYNIQRRDASGGWHPIMPGPNPTRAGLPAGTNDGQSGAWAINNAEDSRIEPFLQVDANGNIPGGSWNPEYNAAHPELAGRSGYDTAQTMLQAAGRGPKMGIQSMTPNGERSIDQMRQELANAGYNGPQDDQSITEAYNRTSGAAQGGGSTGGGNPSAVGGFGPLIDANGRLSTADFGLRDNADKRAQRDQDFNQQLARDARYDSNRNADLNRWQQGDQFDKTQHQNLLTNEEGRYDTRLTNDRNLYSNLAQNLLNSSVQLSAQPRDYFKYNQMLSGGKDIFQQLYGDTPRAEFSGFTGGEPESGRITDIMGALGMPQVPGGSIGSDSAAERKWVGDRVPTQPYNPQPDLPFQAPNTDYRQQATNATAQLKSAYQGLIKQLGVPYLSWDDPRLLKVYRDVTGLDETGARRVSQAASDYSRDVGGVIPDNLLSQHIADAYSSGTNTNPSLNRATNANAAYNNASNAAGKYLGPQDPRTLGIYGNVGGLNPAQASQATQQGHDWAGATGYAPTANDTMSIIDQARRGQPMQPRRALQAPQYSMAA